jgi:hypothetical protein
MRTKASDLSWGLVFGIVFGFLLHKGGVTNYDVIIGQLLLTDFTVLKIMLSAVVVGAIGIHTLQTSRDSPRLLAVRRRLPANARRASPEGTI